MITPTTKRLVLESFEQYRRAREEMAEAMQFALDELDLPDGNYEELGKIFNIPALDVIRVLKGLDARPPHI